MLGVYVFAAVPDYNKNCADSIKNLNCVACDLWKDYAQSDQACTTQTVTYCHRMSANFVTLVKVPQGKSPSGQHYLALPNKAVTGVENWKDLNPNVAGELTGPRRVN